RALHARLRLALEGHVIQAPDPFLLREARVDAPATRAAQKRRAVAALETPLGVVRLAGLRVAVGEARGLGPLRLVRKHDRCGLADQGARGGADHLLEEAV